MFYLKLLLISAFFTFLFGCTTLKPSKPNTPLAGPYPESLLWLTTENPILAEEITKLPEIQDGFDEIDFITLNKIAETYKRVPILFESAFNEMLKVGKPNMRKYCTPLQSFFWMVENGKIEIAHSILKE